MKPFFVGLLAAGAVSAAAQSLADVNVFYGQALPSHSIYHQQLIQGGILTFVMSPKPQS